MMVQTPVSVSFLISRIASRYFLFDINAITYVRREHNICGVLIGNIPQATQQTVFSGIPLELMPEEAKLLVEKGHALITDDVKAHGTNFTDLSQKAKETFLAELRKDGLEAAYLYRQHSLDKKKAYLERVGSTTDAVEIEDLEPMQVTPTTSFPPLQAAMVNTVQDLPKVTHSYELFAHLHRKGYFMGPGLRFGCQYVAYPGDPLRYHSHFLVTGHEWDEDIDLLDIVGGGRLGTGVKKGYMIGGADSKGDVRTFTFEWAAM